MAKKNVHDFEASLQQLKQDYIKRLSGHMAEFRRYTELLNQGFLPARDAQALYRFSHNLIGSGLTFGFPEISEDAKTLNQALSEYMDVDVADIENQVLRRNHVQQELHKFDITCRNVTARSAVPAEGRQKDVLGKAAGFFARKKEDVAALARIFAELGYDAVYAHSMEGLETLNQQKAVSFWIVYSALQSRDVVRFDQLKTICSNTAFYIVSPRESFEARLRALRLGAAGFGSAQEGLPDFARAVDMRVKGVPTVTKPGRILIVDDDDMLAAFYGHALRGAGMEATEAHSAEEAMKVLSTRPFDLAVINVDMPGCSGPELVGMMRQSAPPLTQPVILLSAKENQEKLESGANCTYLTKPFMPEHLIEVVQRRLKGVML